MGHKMSKACFVAGLMVGGFCLLSSGDVLPGLCPAYGNENSAAATSSVPPSPFDDCTSDASHDREAEDALAEATEMEFLIASSREEAQPYWKNQSSYDVESRPSLSSRRNPDGTVFVQGPPTRGAPSGGAGNSGSLPPGAANQRPPSSSSAGPPTRGSPSGGAGSAPSGGNTSLPGNSNTGNENLFGGNSLSGFGLGDNEMSLPGTPGQQPTGFDLLKIFIQQNCALCHSANNPKGNIRLDQFGPDLVSAADFWSGILETLEGGSMPPSTARQPDPSQKLQVIEFLRTTLGSAAEKSYLQQAEQAYKKGDKEKAVNLFYAHALSIGDGEAETLLDHIRFYRPNVAKPDDLKPLNDFSVAIKPRLTTGLTFAVGVSLDAGPQVTDVKPIGVWQRNNAGGGLGGGGLAGRGGPGGFGGGGASKLDSFEDLTGDYGKELVDAFSSRRRDSRYGTLFADLTPPPPGSNPTGGFGQEGLGQNSFGGFGGGGGSTFGGAFTGEPGALSGGPPGRGGPPGAPPPPGLAGRPAKDQPLADGLIFVGKGSQIELLKKAVKAGVDGLFVFDVKATKNRRTNTVLNETRLRFILVSGRVVAASPRTLTNTEVEKAFQENAENTDVQDQVAKVFERLDSIISVEPVPTMPSSAALRYIHNQLHSDSKINPLEIMAQARLFHSKGFITEEELAMIYQIVLEGNEGVTLASGSPEDRKFVLDAKLSSLIPDNK